MGIFLGMLNIAFVAANAYFYAEYGDPLNLVAMVIGAIAVAMLLVSAAIR